MKYYKRISLISIVVLTIIACTPKPVYEKAYKLKQENWDRFNTLNFETELEQGEYDLFIHVKNTDKFNYKVLPVFISISNNEGEERYRELDLLIKNDEGEFIGNRTDDIIETTIVFFDNYKLEKPGRLSVTFEKIIPKVVTSGIAEVGLVIEKAK